MIEFWFKFHLNLFPGVQVGIGSRSHDFDADERIIFNISSFDAGFSDPRIDFTAGSPHWLSV